jgi:hypothetical protein
MWRLCGNVNDTEDDWAREKMTGRIARKKRPGRKTAEERKKGRERRGFVVVPLAGRRFRSFSVHQKFRGELWRERVVVVVVAVVWYMVRSSVMADTHISTYVLHIQTDTHIPTYADIHTHTYIYIYIIHTYIYIYIYIYINSHIYIV